MVAAVIFDLDGLLIDSERMVKEAFEATVAELGATVPDGLFQSLIGRNAADSRVLLVEALGADFPHEACREGMSARYEAALGREGMPIKPGAEALLGFLRGETIPVAIATSSASARARYKLELAGLHEWFPTIVGGDEVARGKPEPDIFLKAAQTLQVVPEQCVVFEDSYAGVRAAAAASMVSIMVPDQLPPTDEMRALTLAIVDDLHAGARVIEERLAGLAR
ncbi:MAG: HAD family phosphatase [Pseudomonadota bacterium]